ncbi:MAG: glutamate--tRNA ligase [Acidobacteria bacterium]|nr:glutamate--tRNA ligase [Acidobacteriota bacterium]
MRVRFAPSPTGFLHIGGARTFLFNWLYARQHKGEVVLRIDDTDLERSTDASLRTILEGLEWLELAWDEQHYQSQRRERHALAAEALLAKGAAYRDFTPASGPDDDKASDAPDGKRKAWLSNPGQRELSREESDRRAAAGEPFVLRFRTPHELDGGVAFKDLVYGKQFRKFADLEDFALVRSDGAPTYHLASCVDDVELRISHIIRGQDHLTNTFKHIQLFEALSGSHPQLGHLPLLLGPDGSKLSKRRHGPIVSVVNYRDAGFLPQAFINFMALLGWSPKGNQEVLSQQELEAKFDVSGILRTNAVVQFDETSADNWAPPKAVWLNGQHLRSMPVEQLMRYVKPELEKAGWWKPEFDGAEREKILATVDAIRSRYTLLSDFSLRAKAYFSDEFEIEDKAVENLNKEGARDGLRALADRLEALPQFNHDTVEEALRSLADERGVKPGLLINGARAALSGQSVGPSAFEVFELIGKDKTVARLRAV